ncbi:MAG TPA: hypothetical protein VMD09_15520 [Solirubrobacteraceae bacterium]|nr:hypothetical protein [Solirubrobacteraceae bacterium]
MQAASDPSNDRPALRPARLNSYLAYSIGCAVAWGVVWVIVAIVEPEHKVNQIAIFFGGWLLGWVSSSIARVVYPPPKKRDWAGPGSFFQGLRGS